MTSLLNSRKSFNRFCSFIFILKKYKVSLYKSKFWMIKNLKLIVVGIILIILSDIIFSLLLHEKIIEMPANQLTLDEDMRKFPLLANFEINLLGPVAEEFVFRATFFKLFFLKKNMQNVILKIAVSGLVFGLLHDYHSIVAIFYVFMGLLLATTYQKKTSESPLSYICLRIYFKNLVSYR